MAKVISVSRFYPIYHPKKGEPTYFVEKIYNALGSIIPVRKNGYYFEQLSGLNPNLTPTQLLGFYNSVVSDITETKFHTIRNGKRWKTGDKASIRVWGDDVNPKSGRKGAYHSKQITIAPDVEITVFDFEIKYDEADELSIYLDDKFYCQIGAEDSHLIAKNDGLNLEDLKSWFNYPKLFSGQILSWSKNLKY